MVSAREALSIGVESSIRVLAKLGPRIGKLGKREQQHFQDAKRWLELSRSCGLFAPSAPIPLPSELSSGSPDSAPETESIPGSLDEFTEGNESLVDDESTAQSCKVEA